MRKMNVLLWIVQGLLCALFLLSGVMKLVTPADTLQQQAHISGSFLKFIGVVEILGALGLVLPGAFHVAEGLTPLAAVGLLTVMIGATMLTLGQGVAVLALIPAITGLLCAFVAYGRLRRPVAATI